MDNSDSLFKNIYKDEYISKYKNGNLIIDKTSCYKVSKEVAFLVQYLPKKGKKEEHLKCLKSLGISNAENVFNKLNNIGILKKQHDFPFFRSIKQMISSFFSPKIILLPCEFQKKLIKYFNFGAITKIEQNHMINILSIVVILVFILGLFYNNYYDSVYLSSSYSYVDLVALVLLVLTGIIIHELGHSFMCYYCGIGIRPIGFSFLLIYPVMFTNVSGIDELGIKERILVNIAGLFSQGTYMLLLFGIFLITGYEIVLVCLKLLGFMFYFNLHPFIKTDGYWFFKDILFFSQKSSIGNIINKLYYVIYGVFSCYLGYKGYRILKSLIIYIYNYREIEFNLLLFVNLFYMYLIIILFKGIKARVLESYYHLFRKKKINNLSKNN